MIGLYIISFVKKLVQSELFGTEHEHAPGLKLTAHLEQSLDLDSIRVATNNLAERNSIISTQSKTIYKVLNRFSFWSFGCESVIELVYMKNLLSLALLREHYQMLVIWQSKD